MKHQKRLLLFLLIIVLTQSAFSFGRFMYFTDEEQVPPDDPGGQVNICFYGADILYGPLHSNGWIKINGAGGGYPQFYGPVTTAKEDVMWINGTVPDYSIFHGGLSVNYPESHGFPYPRDDLVQPIKNNPGLLIPDSAYVDSLAEFCELATTIHIRDSLLMIEQWLYDHFTPVGDTIHCEEHFQQYQYLSLPAPENGTVYFRGKLFLEGWLQGQVTLLASDTIWLIDDVYYVDVAFDGVNWIGNPPEDEKGMP
ncbi:MAG: hypothetical protein K8R46_13250, partial [Pirellulales bacterium]|nr:hypothetical protein [Pirellulales bacterium]